MRNWCETSACKPCSRSPFALDDQGLTLPLPSLPLQCALAGTDQSQYQSYFPKNSFSNKSTISYQHSSENQRYIFQIRNMAGKFNPSWSFSFYFSPWGGDKITDKYSSVPNIQSLLQALNFEKTLRTWNISFPIEKGAFRLKYHVSGNYKAAHARVPFP